MARGRALGPRAAADGAPVELGVLAELVGYRLARAAVAASEVFEHHIGKPLALRKVEFSLLALLLANGALVPKVLGQTLALTPPKLTLLLDRLQERGLVRRERNPADGRSQHIMLTDAGRRLATSAAKVAATMEAGLRERLSRAEQAMLVELLAKLGG